MTKCLLFFYASRSQKSVGEGSKAEFLDAIARVLVIPAKAGI